MSTSNGPVAVPEVASRRPPLRLRIAKHEGSGHLDGGWWPYSRDLAVELADLVARFPPRSGRIVRALVSPSDWDPAPQHLAVPRGSMEIGALHRDDSHAISLTTTLGTVLRLLVVPPDFTRDQGDEALLASATAGNTHSTTDLLEEVLDQPATDQRDHWTDNGGSWWGPGRVAPSFRTGAPSRPDPRRG